MAAMAISRQSASARRTLAFMSVSEVERHAGDHRVRLEQQGSLDEKRRLIMEQMVPPPGRNEFREYDGDVVVGAFRAHLADVLEQRLHQRAIGRLENDQRNAVAIF